MSDLPEHIIDELLESDDDCVVVGQDAETEESLLKDDAPESCVTTATLGRPVATIKPYIIGDAPSSPDSVITVDLSSDEDSEVVDGQSNWSPSFRSTMTYEADPDVGDVSGRILEAEGEVVSTPCSNIVEPPLLPATTFSSEQRFRDSADGFRIPRSPTWSINTEDSNVSNILDLPAAAVEAGTSVGDLTNQFPNLYVNPLFQAPATRSIISQVSDNENRPKKDVKMTYKYSSERRVQPYPRWCGPQYLTLNVPLPPFLFSPPPYFPQYRPNKLFKCRVCMATGKTANLRHHVDICPLKDK
ncbi:unnamed protein product [Allacma fusca]|uniref:Uncharacterized protein n=1 Tax=Allacma fusca TaxID=39272 RepID=A0A8J2JVA3_9HEXA|nr:unnamed protein product [Allacma fusca]